MIISGLYDLQKILGSTGVFMQKRFLAGMLRIFFPAFMAVIMVCGCSSVQINKLPEPSPTAKLRVLVLPVSGPRARGYWGVPDEEYSRRTFMAVGRFLRQKGIYEVIPESDLEKAVGERKFQGWEWKANDWALARQVGKAVHADYLFIGERGDSGIIFIGMTLINLETGKIYSTFDHIMRQQDWDRMAEESMKIVITSYRQIFMAAKADLFETALRRGRLMKGQAPVTGKPEREAQPAPEKTVPPAVTVPEVKAPPPAEIAKALPEKKSKQVKKKPVAKQEKPAGAAPVQTAEAPGAPEQKHPVHAPEKKPAAPAAAATAPVPKVPASSKKQELPAGKVRLIVYDFNAAQHMEVVSLILADALREELFNIGPFVLVNRENISQVMDELKLQQSGLVDEKQAVRIGDWLAANEMVTGKLAALGQVYVLSATRTDISTLRALGMGSVKCPVGKEEDLLSGIPEIARKLAGSR